MKSRLKSFLAAVVLLSIFVPFSFASGTIKVMINGQERQFTPAPINQSGGTLVPMRSFFEALGCEVKWETATQTAIGIRDDKIVKLPIGEKTAYVNDQPRQLTVEAQLIKGNTFIPLRFVGEALGDQVSWDGKTSTISIISSKVSKGVTLKVHFIDVGQADSIYIQAPDDYDILIDGGNNGDGATVVNYLKSQGLDDIELMVATHAHEDHIGGLDDVLEAFAVEEIIDSGEIATTKTYTDYWAAVEAGKVKYQEDRDLTFDLGSNIKFDIIETGDGDDNTNDNSVVAKLDFNSIEFLFTGDMESDVENTILGKNIQADILKVGHHGSGTSSSAAFLKAVNPKVAVISVGKDNTYGHPTQDTLNRLTSIGMGIYRTDTSGTIIITSDGNTYSVNKDTYKNAGTTSEGTVIVPIVPASGNKYIGNSNTKKFHYESCSSAKKISPENRIILKTRDEAIQGGYQPCGICKP